MTIEAQADSRRWRDATAGVVGLLVVANVMSNRVLPGWAYLPWNVVVAAAIVVLARSTTTWKQIAFTEWRRGTAWGAVLLLLTIGVLALAITMPAFYELYHDRRVSSATDTWLYQTFVRIPFGTVLLEEVAFRAVLPGLFMLRWGVRRACIAASLCFGVWHVLPALTLNEVNPIATRVFGEGPGGEAVAVLFAVVSTAVVGMWFCWIRLRSRSVLSTMLAHVASNSGAYTIAWLVTR